MYQHVTTSENAEKILKEGLKPMIGPNSQLNREEEKFIYLCEREDIKFWRIILGRYTILEIDDAAVGEYQEFNYSKYSEIFIDYPVEPQHIRKVNISPAETKQMKTLSYTQYLHIAHIVLNISPIKMKMRNISKT